MQWFSMVVTFVVVWWLVLFMVLPWGASPPDRVERGHAASAPARPRIALKMVVTTLIALAITAGIQWIIESGAITLRPAG